MALIPTNLYITNSKYTYTFEWKSYCWWDADIFNIERKKADIMEKMIWYINNDKSFNEQWLLAIFDEHDSNNEDYYFFRIFEIRNWWKYDDYRNSNTSIWFWFISNRLINI